MRRRSGQGGTICRKGKLWHVRFYVDVPGQEKRLRKSVPVGPAQGKGRLTKAEASRKGAEIVQSFGVNSETHLERALHPESVQTFEQRVAWCRKYLKAWTEAKPGSLASAESHLTKHILPRFRSWPLDAVTETAVLEFVADLRRETFERKTKAGKVVKTYRLSRKTILNIVGVIKLVVGRKVWMAWEIDLGKPPRARQRYYTEAESKWIIETATGQYRVLFALLAATGLRIGEAIGIHIADVDLDHGVIQVRRAVWNGQEQAPKTDAAIREVDIDDTMVRMLREFIGERKEGLLFSSRKGTPLDPGNIRRRVLGPLLKRLGLAHGGLHAFRHGRVTMLRKAGTPGDLQKQWIGHSSLRTGDRYSHTDQELEYRKAAATKVGLDRIVGPGGPKTEQGPDDPLKATA